MSVYHEIHSNGVDRVVQDFWMAQRAVLLGLLVVGCLLLSCRGNDNEKKQKTEKQQQKPPPADDKKQGFQGRDHPIKTECMIPSYMDDLKDGMQYFFGHNEGMSFSWPLLYPVLIILWFL